MKMFQSNIYYFTSIKVYIVSIEEIYGVLSLSMGFYLCLWNSIFVYGVLSLSMEFCLCIWSSVFDYGVVSLSGKFYLCLRNGPWLAWGTVRWLPDGPFLAGGAVLCSLTVL